MSTDRTMKGGWANPRLLKRGPGGRFLCRWCEAVECQGRRSTFCSDGCVHEWKLRTSPAYLRRAVFARDGGHCAVCKLDTVLWALRLRLIPDEEREALTKSMGIAPARRRSPWDADHIIPVAEGGGQCDLSNLQTLCIPCHKRATAELRRRLAVAKKGHSNGDQES